MHPADRNPASQSGTSPQPAAEEAYRLDSAAGSQIPETPHTAHFEKAAELAEEHAEELAALRELLQERHAALPQRFRASDIELMRFAYTAGLSHARSTQDRSAPLLYACL